MSAPDTPEVQRIADCVPEGYVLVPAKIEHKGPRAQVITPSDTVMTREGQILAIALRAAEERELDYLAEIGKLRRLLEDAMNGASIEHLIERLTQIDGSPDA